MNNKKTNNIKRTGKRKVRGSDRTFDIILTIFITIIMMPLAYSISDGILLGMISYVALNICCGNHKKITPTMYILAVMFILKYIFI